MSSAAPGAASLEVLIRLSGGEGLCDRFHGALLGFVTAAHRSGLSLSWLEKNLQVGRAAAHFSGSDYFSHLDHPALLALALLWQSAPILLRSYPGRLYLTAPSESRFTSVPQLETFRDRSGLPPTVLVAVAEVLYMLLDDPSHPPALQQCKRGKDLRLSDRLQANEEADHPVDNPVWRASERAFRAAWQRLIAQTQQGALEWPLCFGFVIDRQRSASAPEPKIGGNLQPLEDALLGLWLGAAGGSRAVPLVQQLAIAPLDSGLQQRAQQIFWQWAGGSQSDRVNVS